MQEQPMTRRQRRLLKKQKQAQERNQQEKKKSTGKWAGLIILAVVIAGAVYGFGRLAATTPDTTFTATPVHWHASMSVEVCGERRDLPAEGSGQAHGKAMVGETIVHHHFDNVMHIEGRIIKAEDISLGKFADSIGLIFDRDRLMEKVNGEACGEDGAPGAVKMFVNDEPSTEFRNYIPKATENAQDQRIRLVFE